MAVSISSADKALKSYYLDAIAEQLNTHVNPFLSMINKTSDDVYGKEVKKLVVYGLNGGVGGGDETGSLPVSGGNKFENFVLQLKNFYGTIEISDKALRATENNSGAFVNLLNSEMEGLLRASNFNFARMLYGDGSGVLATISSVTGNVLTVDNTKNLVEGMCVEIRTAQHADIGNLSSRRISKIDRENKLVTIDGSSFSSASVPEGSKMYVQGSFYKELTGLGAIFSSTGSIYGLDRSKHPWLIPYMNTEVGDITENAIQTALDAIEENSGSTANIILCSLGVRRALKTLLSENRGFVNTMDLAGGYKAMSYNGIPIVADRFCPEGTMYLLNTDDFCLHQLCDWEWLETDDGGILKQVAGKPVYSATLVKYADLLCSRPIGQAMLSGINEE